MPREGIQYWIDDDWRGRVRSRLDEKGWKQADLSRESGCAPSLITELLNGTRNQTTFLPEIHDALGFPPPQSPLLSNDDEELLAIAHALSPEQRARLVERALSLKEEKRKN
jgi:transcriptional regulator with XRE-family HTH domain